VSGPGWETLGRLAPDELVDARLQLHHVAQLVASVGKSLLEPRPDDSHPNLGWLPAERALAGHRVPGARPFQAALRPADLQLLLLDADGKPAEAFSLPGETLDSASGWLARAIEARFERELASDLEPTGYELPPHPVADGAAFVLEPGPAFAELGRWFANADAELTDLAGRTEHAYEVRCWPHHFDLATLMILESGADGSAKKTVGVGLSPGDAGYAEPYWYVTPWPYPDPATELPPLPAGGRWHREGFTAAILTGSDLVASGPAEEQPGRLRAFLKASVAASRRVHGL
jgi:hypothetical protein